MYFALNSPPTLPITPYIQPSHSFRKKVLTVIREPVYTPSFIVFFHSHRKHYTEFCSSFILDKLYCTQFSENVTKLCLFYINTMYTFFCDLIFTCLRFIMLYWCCLRFIIIKYGTTDFYFLYAFCFFPSPFFLARVLQYFLKSNRKYPLTFFFNSVVYSWLFAICIKGTITVLEISNKII